LEAVKQRPAIEEAAQGKNNIINNLTMYSSLPLLFSLIYNLRVVNRDMVLDRGKFIKLFLAITCH
jgi:hypothetical protein